jgi:hypothetical protein
LEVAAMHLIKTTYAPRGPAILFAAVRDDCVLVLFSSVVAFRFQGSVRVPLPFVCLASIGSGTTTSLVVVLTDLLVFGGTDVSTCYLSDRLSLLVFDVLPKLHVPRGLKIGYRAVCDLNSGKALQLRQSPVLSNRVESDCLILIPESFPAGKCFCLPEKATLRFLAISNCDNDVLWYARTDDGIAISPVFVRRMENQARVKLIGARKHAPPEELPVLRVALSLEEEKLVLRVLG